MTSWAKPRGDADDQARRDQRRQRRRRCHHQQGDDQHRELDEDQPALVEASPSGREKKCPREIPRSECRHPADRGRVRVELRGEGASMGVW